MSNDEASEWAHAFLTDLAAAPMSQRRTLIEGKVTMRGNHERNECAEQLRILSLPETTPGLHALARQRLRAAADALAERIAEIIALNMPITPHDVRLAAAQQLPALTEFAALTTNALTAAQPPAPGRP